MKTFLANLQHAARNGESVSIGGGQFSPAECQAVVDLIRDAREVVIGMAFTVETVAHLRNMERELLPVTEKARTVLARFEL